MCRLATFVAMLLLCAPLSAQQALFRNAAIGFGGGTILDMKTADVNNDGKPDVVLLQVHQVDGVTVSSLVTLLGNGDGTFSAPLTSVSASRGTRLALGDLNGDGKADVVLSCSDSKLETYRGVGNGSFTFVASQAANISRTTPLVLVDLDDDGKLDLIANVVSAAFTPLATFHGNGDGTFGPAIAQPLVALEDLSGITVGDFNGDGRVDVVVCSSTEYWVLLGRGDGGFNPLTVGSRFAGTSAVVGDFNGDGKLDFVAMGRDENFSLGGAAVLYVGDGRGGFTQTAATNLVGELNYGVSADLDGDGKLDIVSSGDDIVTVMRGNGDGTFVVHSYVGSVIGPPLVADFDGDHHPDVLSGLSSSLLLLHGNGDGTLDGYGKTIAGINQLTGAIQFTPRGLATADFNGDGKPDVVTSNDGIVVLLNNGAGGFGPPIPLVTPGGLIRTQSVFGTGDVNGDGKVDIVVVTVAEFVPGVVLWTFLGNGDGTFRATSTAPVGALSHLFLTDVNGDGRLDVFLSAAFSGGEVHLGKGDGTFGPPIALSGDIPALIADFNGDGRPDYIAVNFDSGYTFMLNDGLGGFTAGTTVSDARTALAVGDFNGDGKIDLVDQGGDGSIRMRLGNGDGTFTDLPALAVPASTVRDVSAPGELILTSALPVAGDFDGDGKLDLAFSNRVLLGKGDGAFSALVPAAVSKAWPTIAAADMDGNGSTDLLMLDTSNNAINILLTRTASTGTKPLAVTLGTSVSPAHFQEKNGLSVTASTPSSSAPSGGAAIAVDGILIGFVDWNSSLPWTPRLVGDHRVVATFIGDDVFAPGSVTLSLPVMKLDSLAQLGAFPEPSQQKQFTTILALLSTQEANVGPVLPSGTITVREGTAVLFSGPYNPTQQGLLVYPSPTVGTHLLTLEYSGDANYTSATASLSHVVIRDTVLVGIGATPKSPLTVGQALTVTASIGSFVDASGGIVTFLDNGVSIGSAVIRGLSGSITFQPPWGLHSYTARYGGNADLDPASTTFALAYTVNLGPFGTPIEVRATAVSTTNVNVDWSPLTGVTTYDLSRRGPGGSLTVFSGFTVPHVNDTTVAPNTTYLYQVVAHNNAGATSAPSARDWATTVPFTNDPLVPGTTTVKALHVLELRTAINAMRAAAGLPAATWSSDPTHAFIRASDLTELRAALAAARSALGVPVAFTDPTLTPRGTTIRGIHFQEIRDAVK
jgi:hypothetical protein